MEDNKEYVACSTLAKRIKKKENDLEMEDQWKYCYQIELVSNWYLIDIESNWSIWFEIKETISIFCKKQKSG